jgi:hypothetical protein
MVELDGRQDAPANRSSRVTRDRIIYWGSTGVLCAMMAASAAMYVFVHPQVSATFVALGYPTYLIYALAVAKLLGVLAILTKKSPLLKDLAYAGFFYDFLLAGSAHLHAGDGEFIPALAALLLLIVSFIYDRKLYSRTKGAHDPPASR